MVARGDARAYGFDMDEIFAPAQRFKTRGPAKTIHSTKGTRREVLWTNYEAEGEEGLFV